ncbi:unnamed protein product [Urochloa decumbens]|uniref:Uncharacterized protein n=1 Tax=Urochloa decumbens TaxID=240449 RepID=A0ABC8WJN9_9POAL
MDGLIPLVLKALKKKKTMKHYCSLSSSDHMEHADVTELLPQVSLFMTPQHPKASRWHGGDGNIFMTPQHPSASRWLDGAGDGGNDEAAPTPAFPVACAKSSNTRRLPTMEATPLTASHERGLSYGGSCHGGK